MTSKIIKSKCDDILKYLKIDDASDQAKQINIKLIKIFTEYQKLIFKPDDSFNAEALEI